MCRSRMRLFLITRLDGNLADGRAAVVELSVPTVGELVIAGLGRLKLRVVWTIELVSLYMDGAGVRK